MALSAYNHPTFPFQNAPNTYYGDSAPTSGSFNVGDVVYNTAQTAGSARQWVCVSASPLVFVPSGFIGEGPANISAFTAAGAATGTPGWITASGFAGNITLAPSSNYAVGFSLVVQDLTTHAVTLVAASGSILGPSTALASTLAAAQLVADGANWRRLT